MTDTAVDTSVAVPLLVSTHTAHRGVAGWARGRLLVMSGHALVETYSVLTRLPGDARLAPPDAAALLEDAFGEPAVPDEADSRRIHREFAGLGITGGAVYDGLVAMAARRHNLTLATRDARARGTYEAIGIQVELVDS